MVFEMTRKEISSVPTHSVQGLITDIKRFAVHDGPVCVPLFSLRDADCTAFGAIIQRRLTLKLS